MSKKIKVKIIENSLLARLAAKRLGTKNMAITFGRTIHLYNATRTDLLSDKRWLLHELRHVQQYKDLGFFRFIYKYLVDSARYGYHNNPLEVEARAAEEEDAALEMYAIVKKKNTNLS